MKRMKRSLAFLLIMALLLPITGQARQQYYTIAELREQAAQGWQQTYTAHGRSIAVDVSPHVPQVDAVPMSAYKLADLQPVPDALGRWTYEFSGVPGSVMIMVDEQAVTGNRGFTQGSIWHGGYEMDRKYLPGNNQTLGEMIVLVAEVLSGSGLNPEALYWAHPFSVMQGIYQSKAGMVQIEFYQSLRGLPMVGDSYKAYLYGMKPADGRVVPDRTSTVLMRSPSQFVMFLSALVEEAEQLAPDLPLAAFAQVIASLEAEIAAGRLRQVFQISLGYALFADKANQVKPPIRWNEEDRFYALPVWAVDCIYVDSAKTILTDYSHPSWEGMGKDPYNVLEYKRLHVNAQTGKLIDPTNQSADRVVFPGYLSWEEAGGK